ncbi:hypothetical protein [Hydrogenophaga sp. R2]|uniref:hypothetical protein n=1 Tax=Hydrogenophaga sp. R2 TaxID=3132827 RepID=UPI003CE7C301
MKLLSRRQPLSTESPSDSTLTPAVPDDIESGLAPFPLADEYALTIHFCLSQHGLDNDQMRVSVRPVGSTPGGLDIYAGFVKVLRWTPPVRALVVQMPWVERRIERRLRQTGLLQYSQFGGLWFRSPGQLAHELPRH